MNSRKWVRLFFTTLMIGGGLTLLLSFLIKRESYAEVLQPFQLFELFGLLLFFSGLGFIFSVISQMGFFAYLTVNQFGKGFFRSLWVPAQVFLIAFTLFDLVYFRYQGSDSGDSIWFYIGTAAGLFTAGAIIAYIKAKETNRTAFIPGLFFMVVVTSIEWVPALNAGGKDYIWLMIFPLFVCNAYQLLLLHRLTRSTDENMS
ncbi:KinB-signaling pathway activation protein [Halobacillus sp. ACCC02827]|uniref:KinB-signaling pathway activation protein n=1 Tax=Bacillaceae TaxID=186817 RepID=UPI0002A4D933|nr:MULTISPECIES: KinB-signaling pathway activation protein [Bacillaceae]ELK47869.1 KinB signaling pathway activation protein [Halobacillus sp. BAB-2008]QHT45208.1 KinB-signaling pathway activation protein [Bacillus sp. SB49]WJE15989.1 KinB-signaling pathway activation protein [Halobacillus sp. ACCC02827]